VVPVLQISSVYRTPIFTLKVDLGLANEMKKVYGAVYHGDSVSWRFPAFFPVHSFVLSDLAKLVPNLELHEETVAHVAELEKTPVLPSEFSFVTDPYQHQMDGLLHLYRHLRAGLFYSPGLGKCKVTVDLQRLTGDHSLILCPRVMLHTWAAEFGKHGNIEDVVVVDGYNTKKKQQRIQEAISTNPVATIVTYKMASLYYEQLIKIPYSVIVADESHQMKTPFAQRTKASRALAGRAYRRILLSGTPSLGSPFDMYAQLRFLGKYFCAEHWWAFRKMFGVFPAWEKDEAKPKMVLGFKNFDIMNERVNLICQRKTKEECLDLPDQVVIDIKFPVYGAQKKAYNSMIMERCDAAGSVVKDALEEGTLDQSAGKTLQPYVYVPEVISLLNKLDQIGSGFTYQTQRNPRLCDGCKHVHDCVEEEISPYTTKCQIVSKAPDSVVNPMKKNARLDELVGLLETVLEDEANKVIIWASYRVELDQIEKAVKKFKVGYTRVEGGMTGTALHECMVQFNSEPACRVYIGQVSTGVGITLNAANYTIYYNLPWSLDHYLQSLDRNYRIGQDRKVTVYRLIGRHTLDDAKATALSQKTDFSNLVTARSVCVTCPELKRCLKHKITVYDEDCIYDRTMLRDTAQVRLIP